MWDLLSQTILCCSHTLWSDNARHIRSSVNSKWILDWFAKLSPQPIKLQWQKRNFAGGTETYRLLLPSWDQSRHFALMPNKNQDITYPDFSPSPRVSLWLIASCRPSSCNPPQLKDEWRCHRGRGNEATLKGQCREAGKRGDLLCLPAWLLLLLAAKCEGDACPFMCGFLLSVLDGAGNKVTEGKEAHSALSIRGMTSAPQHWAAVLLCYHQGETSPLPCVKCIVLQNAKYPPPMPRANCSSMQEDSVLDVILTPHMLNVAFAYRCWALTPADSHCAACNDSLLIMK